MSESRRRAVLGGVVLAVSLMATACTTGSAPGTPPSAPTSSAAPSTGAAPGSASPTAATTTTFAVIGDFGRADGNEKAVAKLVKSWKPGFIITVGDNYYAPAGGSGTERYDRVIGAYYCAWLADVTTSGTRCPSGTAKKNAFFPSLGNHDHSDATPSLSTYLKYFRLPGAGFTNTSGNERYYDFVEGSVHFFAVNSNPQEPDGTSASSKQAAWLKKQLATSTSTWNIVYEHHPPYSSDATHGSTKALRWPFAAWGADAVISGHSHTYERVNKNGIVYFVNGLGGAPRYSFRTPVSGSKVRYRANWGAQYVTATATTLTFTFRTVKGKVVDTYRIKH